MTACKTVDDLLAVLTDMKQKHGGDCRVLLRAYKDQYVVPSVHEGATGKANGWKLVSRGGNPCVIIGE